MRISADAPCPDWSEFEVAVDCADRELRSYYDTMTGEVCITGPFEDDPGERERIDAAPERYLEIGRIESHEEYEWMERFTAEVTNTRLKFHLERALARERCFRWFRDALLSAPTERAQWFAFRDGLVKRWIEQWFELRDLAVGAPPSWWTAPAAAPAQL